MKLHEYFSYCPVGKIGYIINLGVYMNHQSNVVDEYIIKIKKEVIGLDYSTPEGNPVPYNFHRTSGISMCEVYPNHDEALDALESLVHNDLDVMDKKMTNLKIQKQILFGS